MRRYEIWQGTSRIKFTYGVQHLANLAGDYMYNSKLWNKKFETLAHQVSSSCPYPCPFPPVDAIVVIVSSLKLSLVK
jgi:hypothetical protein